MVYSINTEYSIWNIIINTGLLIATEIIMVFVFFKKPKKEETEKLGLKLFMKTTIRLHKQRKKRKNKKIVV